MTHRKETVKFPSSIFARTLVTILALAASALLFALPSRAAEKAPDQPPAASESSPGRMGSLALRLREIFAPELTVEILSNQEMALLLNPDQPAPKKVKEISSLEQRLITNDKLLVILPDEAPAGKSVSLSPEPPTLAFDLSFLTTGKGLLLSDRKATFQKDSLLAGIWPLKASKGKKVVGLVLPAALFLRDQAIVDLVSRMVDFLKAPETLSLAAGQDQTQDSDSSASGAENPSKILVSSLVQSYEQTPADPCSPGDLQKWLAERQRQSALEKQLLGSLVSEALEGSDETLSSAMSFMEETGQTSPLEDQDSQSQTSENDSPSLPEDVESQLAPGGQAGAAIARILKLAARRTATKVASSQSVTTEGSANESQALSTASSALQTNSDDQEDPVVEADGETTLGVGLPPESMPDPFPKIKNGAIIGIVELTEGQVPSGAVRVEARGDGVARVTRTGVDGTFRISDLPLGEYSVIYIAPGYTPSYTTLDAIVENGATYSMPSLILEAAASQDPGAAGGTVINAVSGSPMEGVAVMVAGHTALSDSNGSFTFSGLTPGDATIRASASGYRAYSSDLIVVAGGTVSHRVIMEPASGTMGGVITLSDSAYPIDWDELEGQVIISVSGLVHQVVDVQGGYFSLQVPALLDSYTVELRAPWCETSSVVVNGPLYPGGTLLVEGLTLKRRYQTVSFRIITEASCTGSVYLQFRGGSTAGPSSDFSGSNSALLSSVRLPMGTVSATVRGASGLNPAHSDGDWQEMTIGPSTGEMALYINKQ